jgi:hypothetical protein
LFPIISFFIHSVVPQGSILGPLLYVLYTCDLPTSRGTTLSTFADDTAIFATHEDPTIASLNLKEHLNSIEIWLQKWKIEVNESKSSHITFTLRKGHCPAVNINQTIIPQAESVKYLGLQFDRMLTWKDHIAKKRKQINLKIKEINWIIGKKFHLSIENKLLIYNAIIKPIWSYGIELWGCASKSHIVIMQRTQSKLLRAIANAPWYVTNHTLNSDLKVPYVRDVIHERIGKHHTKLEAHPIPLLEPLLQPAYNRRLNRRWPFDLQDTWGDIAGCTPHHSTVSQQHISLKIDYNPSDC